jgi:hypothetical protein
MPEAVAEPPALSCYPPVFEIRTIEFQAVSPDLFLPSGRAEPLPLAFRRGLPEIEAHLRVECEMHVGSALSDREDAVEFGLLVANQDHSVFLDLVPDRGNPGLSRQAGVLAVPRLPWCHPRPM